MGNSENTPLVSVLVITYNQEATVGRAIESVLAQSCSFPYEIIIGEDCSADSTPAVCRSYAERYPDKIRLIANASNKGLIDNYYDCLLEAKGKYIADCAGDDYWTDPHRLQRQVEFMETHSDVTLVHSGWKFEDSETHEISEPAPRTGKFEWRLPIIDGKELLVPFIADAESPIPIVVLSAAIFRRDVFLKAYREDTSLFRNKEYRCEDVPVTAAMMNAGMIAFLPGSVMNYSVGHSSVSSNENYAKTFDFYFGVLKLKLRLIAKYGLEGVLDEPSFIHGVHYLVAQAFLSESKERMDAILGLVKANGLKLTAKGKIYRLLSRIRPLWRSAAKSISN